MKLIKFIKRNPTAWIMFGFCFVLNWKGALLIYLIPCSILWCLRKKLKDMKENLYVPILNFYILAFITWGYLYKIWKH